MMTKQALKIVISGPVGAGKTSLITTLTDAYCISTEARSSEQIGKTHTTVGLDFGVLQIGGQTIHLCGTPGQARFDFMWDILCQGTLGLVLMVAANRPQDFPHARRILEFITSRKPLPFVIGVTKSELEDAWQTEDVAAYFELEMNQVIALNATQLAGSRAVIASLLRLLQTVSPVEA
ncbi:GTP-binding protein [Paraherbaspirillum soli]|uniref:ATP/GTP-binding protein n=1 Tax=Paraherbaspirillum soli TaxID=631222 RepID=A0ABW0M574_9BURK